MRPRTTRITPANAFTVLQWEFLHPRYQKDHSLWSTHELARLRFLRWLYRTNRLGAGHRPCPPPAFAQKEVRSAEI